MKIGVFIKQVPDTETKIKIKSDGTGIEEAGIKFVLSPYDEFAVEEAIKIKEKGGEGETFVISLGPERVVESLRTALAMGIDKGIHIQDEGLIFDSATTAHVLAGVAKKMEFDILLCGKQAIDCDNGQVPQMMAEFLQIPQVMIIDKFDLREDKKGAVITRRISGGAKEIYETDFPVILGCEKGLNTPRYASLPGIMKAKSKPVEKIPAATLLEGEKPWVGFAKYELPPERSAGKKLEGEPPQQAALLAKLLREEAKVI